MLWNLTFLLLGFCLLAAGADILVKGATRLAAVLGISTLMIGLTVVAFGTSAPELVVSIVAAWRGTPDIAVGNVIGSNIFNVLVIIGLAAIIAPIRVPKAIIRREYPVMLVVMLAFLLLSLNEVISRVEGLLLFSALCIYLLVNYFIGRRSARALSAIYEVDHKNLEKSNLVWNVCLVVLGLIITVVGAELCVNAATSIALEFGVSDLVIAVTIVAIGTSLPEVATTIVAAVKNEPDLAIGNAVGSNIFNVLCVLGVTGSLIPLSINPAAINFDLIFMFAACFLLWPLMIISKKINRMQGGLMLLAYLYYVVSLIA